MPAADRTQHLYVKSFFAPSVQEAIEQAQAELGPDALLLNSREAQPEARYLGAYEVVFGGCPEPAATPTGGLAPTGMDEIRKQMEQIHGLLTRMTPGPWPPKASLVEQALVSADLDPNLAREIADAAKVRAGRRSILPISGPRESAISDEAALISDVAAEIAGRFEVNSELGRITALVGPPGSGKTTALVKLAVTYGVAEGKPVRLICMDTHRIGGADQLRTYASILGAGFQAAESGAALAHAIDTAPPEALVLIDTPGYSAPLLRDYGSELATILSHRQEIDTHLVLTASMQPAALRSLSELYAVFHPAKLLLTRLDETNSCAAAFCEAVLQGKPLSFFGTGQAVPEDLEPVSKQRVVDSLVRELPRTLRAVA